MELEYSEIENGITLLKLIGILDAQGVGAIETKFAGYSTGDNTRVLVDLADVEFLTSIGIGLLVSTAKSVARRGGKLAILNPNENVRDVLQMTGIMDIVPIHMNITEAINDLTT
ncbi:MAG: STAS domain-containing protein [Anaerolineales bacterium]|nr:STAS domain-containing protein [Anaerolineales bacterium]